MNDIPFASTFFKTIIYADDITLLANLSDLFFKNNTEVKIKKAITICHTTTLFIPIVSERQIC